MSVFITLAVVGLVAFWGFGRYTQILGLRQQVLSAWRQVKALEADLSATEQSLEQARHAYNQITKEYNLTIGVTPNNIIALLGSLKEAALLDSKRAKPARQAPKAPKAPKTAKAP